MGAALRGKMRSRPTAALHSSSESAWIVSFSSRARDSFMIARIATRNSEPARSMIGTTSNGSPMTALARERKRSRSS